MGQPHLWRSLTELACLGTVSDMMVLQGENRALVADGIECMHHSTRPGLAALAQIAKVDLSTVAADDLPFSIIPRLNAAGRMGSTDIAFKLLFTDDIEEASLRLRWSRSMRFVARQNLLCPKRLSQKQNVAGMVAVL